MNELRILRIASHQAKRASKYFGEGPMLDKEDFRQEALMGIWESGHWKDETPASLLYSIAHRAAGNAHRATYKRSAPVFAELENDVPVFDLGYDIKELYDRVVLFLNEEKNELAKRYFLLGESYSEIARGLGITTAAVHKKAMSTIKKLRKELNK